MKIKTACVLVVLTAFAAACGDDTYGAYGYGGESAGGGAYEAGKPSGEAACAERYFAKRNFECATIDCGEAMLCTSDLECLTCVDRCQPVACGSDQDCADAYGDLCTDVDWRCEPYFTADDLHCAVYAAGASQCGDGLCEADESCSGCSADCGYCPGAAPQMAPCSSDAECQSGFCDDWCGRGCTSGWDCIGDGNGVLTGYNGDCIYANDGNWWCFPYCSQGNDCSLYPGTSCQLLPDADGSDAWVCSA